MVIAFAISKTKRAMGWPTVLDVPGCHTQGRGLDTARRRIKEALELCVPDAEDAELTETNALAVARRALAARTRAEHAQEQAQVLLQDAVRRLLDANLSHRDAAIVLGISHQRVAQLAQQKRQA